MFNSWKWNIWQSHNILKPWSGTSKLSSLTFIEPLPSDESQCGCTSLVSTSKGTCNANAQEISWSFLLQGAHMTQSAQWTQADRKVSWITTLTEKRFNDKMYLMQNMVQRGGVCVYSMYFWEGWAHWVTATVQNMAQKIMCFYEGEFNVRNVDNSLSCLGRRKEQVWGSGSSTQCISVLLHSGISHSLLQVKPKSICKVVVAFLQLALTISLSTNHPLEKKK